jgi:hypothetical protein
LIKSAKIGAFSGCDQNLGYYAICIRKYPKAARMKHFVMWAKLVSATLYRLFPTSRKGAFA